MLRAIWSGMGCQRARASEPWGRIGSGVAELIAAILLLTPGTVVYGAVLSLGIITGAILSHLTKLGVKYSDGPHMKPDGGGFAFIDAPEGYEVELIQRSPKAPTNATY